MATSINLQSDLFGFMDVLRPHALKLTRSKEESEDLLQETMLRALVNHDKFAEGTNIKAWLFTIMRNIFINNYRRDQKKGMVLGKTEQDVALSNPGKLTVKNEADNTFLGEHLEKAFETVSKDFTIPFMMYYNGYKYQEIADHLDLPLGTVKSRIFFARKELQSRLAGMGIHHSTV